MTRRTLDRIVAALVFGGALLLYGATVAPTVAFWDTGEFIASAHTLQVNHPPGAPLYLLVSHVASLLVPPEHVALAVNAVSVLCSALTVLLTHLIVVALARRWRTGADEGGWTAELPALGGGAVGAFTLAAADSFWFNAVEAEVYAMAAFLAALACWLSLRWSARVDPAAFRDRGGTWATLREHRSLVLIALVFGLAIGVHLLSLLAFFFVGVVVYGTALEREAWSRRRRWGMRLAAAGGLGAVFLLLYPGIVKGVPALIDATGAPLLVLVGLAGAVVAGLWGTARHGWARAHLATLCVAAVLVGYSTYALVPIRSATDPPIDIGDPETTEAFVSYLNRAQYGSTPLLSGRTFDDETGRVRRDGETSLFPRRHSLQPSHWRVYGRYASDWAFFWEYQVGHMYLRYLLWNFAGKASDTQNAPARTGVPAVDAAPPANETLRTPSEKESRNAYYALPLLLGLVGAVYHFARDERRALAVLALFLATGLGIVVYLNQTPMQPRPRDYSFVVNIFAVSLWVGLGAAGLLATAGAGLRRLSGAGPAARAAGGALLATLLLAVPGQMLHENYGDHDRSGRTVARDYAYNMLTSVAEDSILFTYGDNDTYPLWYLQNVEGVRPDVRVVNLSLLGTPWYAKQLKEPSNASAPVPMSLSDERLERLRYRRWSPKAVQLPVDTTQLLGHQPRLRRALSTTDSLERPMSWRLRGRAAGGDRRALSVADQVVYNILRTNAEKGWPRPVYFSVTTPPSSHLNLEPYFQLEGLAHRVVPARHETGGMGRVVPGLTAARFADFRLTNLDDPSVHFGDTARGLVGTHYRLWPAYAARQLAEQGRPERARRLLTRFTEKVPFDVIPADSSLRLEVARAFRAAGAPDRARTTARSAEPLVLDALRTSSGRRQVARALREAGTLRALYRDTGARSALARFDDKLAPVLDDLPTRLPERVREQFGLPGAGSTS